MSSALSLRHANGLVSVSDVSMPKVEPLEYCPYRRWTKQSRRCDGLCCFGGVFVCMRKAYLADLEAFFRSKKIDI